jgi:hypothetical protein
MGHSVPRVAEAAYSLIITDDGDVHIEIGDDFTDDHIDELAATATAVTAALETTPQPPVHVASVAAVDLPHDASQWDAAAADRAGWCGAGGEGQHRREVSA